MEGFYGFLYTAQMSDVSLVYRTGAAVRKFLTLVSAKQRHTAKGPTLNINSTISTTETGNQVRNTRLFLTLDFIRLEPVTQWNVMSLCLSAADTNKMALSYKPKDIYNVNLLTRDCQRDLLRRARGWCGSGASSLGKDLAETWVVDGQGDLVGARRSGYKALWSHHLSEVLCPCSWSQSK